MCQVVNATPPFLLFLLSWIASAGVIFIIMKLVLPQHYLQLYQPGHEGKGGVLVLIALGTIALLNMAGFCK
jgi:hypothetical protein